MLELTTVHATSERIRDVVVCHDIIRRLEIAQPIVVVAGRCNVCATIEDIVADDPGRRREMVLNAFMDECAAFASHLFR